MLFLGSCTKDDLSELDAGTYKVRIFDDTLPDPRSHSVHIASSDGRLASLWRFYHVGE